MESANQENIIEEHQSLLYFTKLKKLNLNCEANPKDLLMRLTSKEELQAQAKDKEIMNLKTSIPPGTIPYL